MYFIKVISWWNDWLKRVIMLKQKYFTFWITYSACAVIHLHTHKYTQYTLLYRPAGKWLKGQFV